MSGSANADRVPPRHRSSPASGDGEGAERLNPSAVGTSVTIKQQTQLSFLTGQIVPSFIFFFFFPVCSNPNVPAQMIRYGCRGVARNCVDQIGDNGEEARDVVAVILNECTEFCGPFRGGRKCHLQITFIYVTV